MSINQSKSSRVLQQAAYEPLPDTSSSPASAQVTHLQSEPLSHSLLHIAERLNSTSEVDTLLDILIQEAIALIGAQSGCAGLYTPQGMVCHKYFQGQRVLPPELQAAEEEIIAKLCKGMRIEHYETVRVAKDGRKIDVSLSISPVKDSHGTIIGAAKIARDMTEHKRLEAKFRRLFDSNLIGVFVSDFAGTFLDANDAFLDLLGYTREELLTGTMQRDTLTPPEFHRLSQNAVKALQETGASNTYEKEYIHKSGRRIPVLVAVKRIEHTETCIGFVLNISEPKELDQRKDEFISMASHELKTPLTSLKGFTYVLQRHLSKQEDDQAVAILAKIEKQIDKLTTLINDLLDLSKIQTGKLDYREEYFDLDALVREIVENVQGTTHTHRLLVEGQTHGQVFGDKDRLGQVLINLLTNAIKYSPQADKVIVHLSTDQEQATVSVQDFGIGIAKEYQQSIFDRFYQVADPQERSYPGLGIGLYISSEIIKRHHGRLTVESSKGDGATFSLVLPCNFLDEESKKG